jgi:hypothetical protein
MANCNQCSNIIPGSIFIKNKEIQVSSKRKRCFECSPFGKNLPKEDWLNNPKKLGLSVVEKICPTCQRLHNWCGTLCPACKSNFQRYTLKVKMIEYKGGKCQKCGYIKNLKALAFHHRDRTTKSFNIGGSHSRKWKVLKTELDKCDLVCSNCHIEIEDELLIQGGNQNRISWLNGSNHSSIDSKLNPHVKILNHCVDCSTLIERTAERCITCRGIKHRKTIRPNKEDLQKLMWEKPTTALSKEFGVSDKAIEKWCKSMNISKPPRGYWTKLASNKKPAQS